MLSTPEKDRIDSKRMRVETMTEKGEVRFAEECKRLLDLCDGIGTKGDKKHAKREDKARLRHKYYWVNQEEDTLFNGMKAVYNNKNVPVDTPGHEKDVVDGFNAVQKRYLATCLRMCIFPEKYKIDSKRMHT